MHKIPIFNLVHYLHESILDETKRAIDDLNVRRKVYLKQSYFMMYDKI